MKRGRKPKSRVVDGLARCGICRENKPVCEFHADSRKIDIIRSTCKSCVAMADEKRRREKGQKPRKERYKPYGIKYGTKEYKEECRRRQAERNGKAYISVSERALIASTRRAQREERKRYRRCRLCHNLIPLVDMFNEVICNQCDNEREDRKREYIRRKIANQKERYSSDHKYRLNKRLRNAIGKHLRGEKCGRHWFDIVGWTLADLIKHIDKQLKAPLTWDNYGYAWHIDHKIPISAFNFQTAKDIDFKKAWSLKNLQPLLAHDNISKGDRLERPHQPSLCI
jgi:hypothetical protein